MLAYSNIGKLSPIMKNGWWCYKYVPVIYLHISSYTVIWRYITVYVRISGCQDSRCIIIFWYHYYHIWYHVMIAQGSRCPKPSWKNKHRCLSLRQLWLGHCEFPGPGPAGLHWHRPRLQTCHSTLQVDFKNLKHFKLLVVVFFGDQNGNSDVTGMTSKSPVSHGH